MCENCNILILMLRYVDKKAQPGSIGVNRLPGWA